MKEDKKLILEFIYKIYDWLEISFLNKEPKHSWPIIRIREELKEQAKAAWVQFKEDYPKETFNRSISHFRKKRLTSHGLYGAQLEYKLKVIEFAAKNAKLELKGWKRKLLDMLDNLLESIGDGLPGYGALKELKDTILIGIED